MNKRLIPAPTARAAQVVDIEEFIDDDPPPHDTIPESADGTSDYCHEAFGKSTPEPKPKPKPKPRPIIIPPLTIDEWRGRDLPLPDLLMGAWLSTTSRALLSAATGLGKSNFGIALGMRASIGAYFLHWRGHRSCRVLYIDGEMSRRLLRQRLIDEEARMGQPAPTFFALSREDIEQFPPLNTEAGQGWLLAFITQIGGVDVIIFDNIMALTVGDMKDPDAWQKALPLVQELTRRSIGQIWIHHTGHDETRSYGDKSREWMMDTVVHLEAVKRPDTDVSFSLQFRKARERTPSNRSDFQDVKAALVNDAWEHDAVTATRKDHIRPALQKAYDALLNVLAEESAAIVAGRRTATTDQWKAECEARGLIDPKAKPASARTLFATFRRELVAANYIACDGDLTWTL
ncbi:MAG: AAA family ATPase [Nitrobacter sp.]|uniref:AAA family ATPase n=1 Tax=Nitrobacter sp. TaxID=29420 RepID=UPI002626E712|nr:AAA family ATPase [Nitrobacter sp.]MCV0387405.1 AAA family ATPase [Nitrobacter sp.]